MLNCLRNILRPSIRGSFRGEASPSCPRRVLQHRRGNDSKPASSPSVTPSPPTSSYSSTGFLNTPPPLSSFSLAAAAHPVPVTAAAPVVPPPIFFRPGAPSLNVAGPSYIAPSTFKHPDTSSASVVRPLSSPSVNLNGVIVAPPSVTSTSSKLLREEPPAPISLTNGRLPLSPTPLINASITAQSSHLPQVDIVPSSPPRNVNDTNIQIDFDATACNTSTPRLQQQSELSPGYLDEDTFPSLQPTPSEGKISPVAGGSEVHSSSSLGPTRQLLYELHTAIEDSILAIPSDIIVKFDSEGRLMRSASPSTHPISSSNSESMPRKRKSPELEMEQDSPSTGQAIPSPSPESVEGQAPRKRPKRTKKSKARHDVDVEMSDEGDFVISQAEREDLVYELTREKARRLAQAVTLPEDSDLGEEEQSLFLDLATRGCRPLMSGNWRKDFPTLPESLFATTGVRYSDDGELVFEALQGSDFGATRALQELLKIGGHVRDCKVLPVRPQVVIQKAIQKYLRWAVNDAGLRTGPATIPVHAVYAQRSGESTLSAVTRLTKKLETLARRYHATLGGADATYRPTLLGFVICGPIVALVSLDTDPRSAAWTEDIEVKVKYLGQFDLSEEEQDVWNSIAVAISVVHVRNTMIRLAKDYSGTRVPYFWGDEDETDDVDL